MNTAVKIWPTQEVPAEYQSLIQRWSDEIFSAPECQHVWTDVEFEWAPQHWTFLVFCDGEPASHLAITDTTISVGDALVTVGGIGAVMTPKKWRRRGLATLAAQRAGVFIRDRMKRDFGLLFCSDCLIPMYERLGWRQIRESVYLRQALVRILWQEATMILPAVKADWPSGTVDVRGPMW